MSYAAYKTLPDIEKNNPKKFNLWKRNSIKSNMFDLKSGIF